MENSKKNNTFRFKFWGYERKLFNDPYLMEIFNDVYKEYRKLLKRGVDFSENNYVRNSDFQHLCQKYIKGTRISIGWLVELAAVPQKRLAEIYGKYAMGVDVDIETNNLTDEHFENYINLNSVKSCNSTQENYIYKRLSDKTYAHRNAKLRAREWLNIDPERISDLKSKYKFYSLMYDVGESKKINLSSFFGKPSSENMDKPSFNFNAQNQSIMKKIKSELEKELSPTIVNCIYSTVGLVTESWKKIIFDLYNHTYKSDEYYSLDELLEINDDMTDIDINDKISLVNLKNDLSLSNIMDEDLFSEEDEIPFADFKNNKSPFSIMTSDILYGNSDNQDDNISLKDESKDINLDIIMLKIVQFELNGMLSDWQIVFGESARNKDTNNNTLIFEFIKNNPQFNSILPDEIDAFLKSHQDDLIPLLFMEPVYNNQQLLGADKKRYYEKACK